MKAEKADLQESIKTIKEDEQLLKEEDSIVEKASKELFKLREEADRLKASIAQFDQGKTDIAE